MAHSYHPRPTRVDFTSPITFDLPKRASFLSQHRDHAASSTSSSFVAAATSESHESNSTVPSSSAPITTPTLLEQALHVAEAKERDVLEKQEKKRTLRSIKANCPALLKAMRTLEVNGDDGDGNGNTTTSLLKRSSLPLPRPPPARSDSALSTSSRRSVDGPSFGDTKLSKRSSLPTEGLRERLDHASRPSTSFQRSELNEDTVVASQLPPLVSSASSSSSAASPSRRPSTSSSRRSSESHPKHNIRSALIRAHEQRDADVDRAVSVASNAVLATNAPRDVIPSSLPSSSNPSHRQQLPRLELRHLIEYEKELNEELELMMQQIEEERLGRVNKGDGSERKEHERGSSDIEATSASLSPAVSLSNTLTPIAIVSGKRNSTSRPNTSNLSSTSAASHRITTAAAPIRPFSAYPSLRVDKQGEKRKARPHTAVSTSNAAPMKHESLLPLHPKHHHLNNNSSRTSRMKQKLLNKEENSIRIDMADSNSISSDPSIHYTAASSSRRRHTQPISAAALSSSPNPAEVPVISSTSSKHEPNDGFDAHQEKPSVAVLLGGRRRATLPLSSELAVSLSHDQPEAHQFESDVDFTPAAPLDAISLSSGSTSSNVSSTDLSTLSSSTIKSLINRYNQLHHISEAKVTRILQLTKEEQFVYDAGEVVTKEHAEGRTRLNELTEEWVSLLSSCSKLEQHNLTSTCLIRSLENDLDRMKARENEMKDEMKKMDVEEVVWKKRMKIAQHQQQQQQQEVAPPSRASPPVSSSLHSLWSSRLAYLYSLTRISDFHDFTIQLGRKLHATCERYEIEENRQAALEKRKVELLAEQRALVSILGMKRLARQNRVAVNSQQQALSNNDIVQRAANVVDKFALVCQLFQRESISRPELVGSRLVKFKMNYCDV